ncbi:hypothetical protein WJX74_007357 [Apatococcus lobatus]|uniref:AAA+ ATPase domain-containing protein n=1 Tax=Apatococcus lobatus TaxID=904363 RepID=A0AAW1SFE4_9CHLO
MAQVLLSFGLQQSGVPPAEGEDTAMELHFRHFAQAPQSGPLQDQLHQLPCFPTSRFCFLSGPSKSGRTTALLQVATTFFEQGCSVLYVCKQELLEECISCMSEARKQAKQHLSQLPMRYLSSFMELQKLAACLHLAPKGLNALIIDDFMEFGIERQDRKSRDAADMMKILAHLHEAVRQQGQQCHLIIAGDCAEKSEHLIRRWFPLTLNLRVMAATVSLSMSKQSLRLSGLDELAVSLQLVYDETSAVHLRAIHPLDSYDVTSP